MKVGVRKEASGTVKPAKDCQQLKSMLKTTVEMNSIQTAKIRELINKNRDLHAIDTMLADDLKKEQLKPKKATEEKLQTTLQDLIEEKQKNDKQILRESPSLENETATDLEVVSDTSSRVENCWVQGKPTPRSVGGASTIIIGGSMLKSFNPKRLSDSCQPPLRRRQHPWCVCRQDCSEDSVSPIEGRFGKESAHLPRWE